MNEKEKFNVLCEYFLENGTLKRTITIKGLNYFKVAKVFIIEGGIVTIEFGIINNRCFISLDIN